jgi:hypothetical protein
MCIKTINTEPICTYCENSLKKLNSCKVSARSSKIHGIRAYAATDLKDFFASPFFELGEARDMRFHEILPGFYFIEVFSCTQGFRWMPDIAWSSIPKLTNPFDGTHITHFWALPKGIYLTAAPRSVGSNILQQSITIVGLCATNVLSTALNS